MYSQPAPVRRLDELLGDNQHIEWSVTDGAAVATFHDLECGVRIQLWHSELDDVPVTMTRLISPLEEVYERLGSRIDVAKRATGLPE